MNTESHFQLLSTLGINSKSFCPHALRIQLPGLVISLHSNSERLIDTLKSYFDCVLLSDEHPQTDIQLFAVQMDEIPLEIRNLPWQDWHREAGKIGRKEACFDADYKGISYRWILKVKTQVVFCQRGQTESSDSALHSFALGPVNNHPNQIINFMLTQFLNHRQRLGSLLGHASALRIHNKGVAIAGLSGGGKSTLMLKLLEKGQHFISNDRILCHATAEGIQLQGIPKQPRINPGTIVFNPRLHGLMSESERQSYLAMPTEELRAHEEKYDADVNQLFWPNCYLAENRLDALVVLNWQANPEHPTFCRQTTLAKSPELVAAIMKTPGVFFAEANSQFIANGKAPHPQRYLDLLGELPCLELTGNIDFEAAERLVIQALEELH
ncbi:HprK-related kinase B [Thiosulfativibrio zosterae]|uniref:HPr kinase n=1 Tax=Thiosulfativibrio zosterae TaxID=2675053 RepID=A0A6F8PPV8_9GAMM|nr:HprK-related kinase B [Thiosulfativibrio zosterae]BBP44161.1 hypothetical protein THMIRHAT_19070 [Thiosulfativibrio zosterae]